MNDTKRPTYRLTLRPEPQTDDPRGIRRLRAAMKCLLRSFRLRCVDIEPCADLIEVERLPGCCPVVTILDVEPVRKGKG